jgi:hypothetical protein
VLITWVPGGPNPLWRSLSLPVRTYPISSDHDDYEYLNGRVAILGGDGTYFNTRVFVVRSAWAAVATSDMLNIK